MKNFLAKVFATYIYYKNRKWIYNPIEYQKKTFKKLINKASVTKFGIEHNFNKIKSYKDYKDKITTKKYENFTQWQLVFDHPNFSKKDVDNIMSSAYRKYYLNPKWLIKYFKDKLFQK